MTACLICDQRDARHRYACAECVRATQRQLRQLEDYAVILAILLTVPARGMSSGGRRPGYGSRPPASDDILTALDYRSGAGAAVFRLRDPRDMDDEPIRSLPASVHGIACWLRELFEETEPRRWTITSEIAYLLGQIDRCSMFQWINELAEDIRELWQQARALAHDRPPGPLGHCLTVTCDGTVWPAGVRDAGERTDGGRTDGGRCDGCRRIYTGLDLVRLHTAQEAS